MSNIKPHIVVYDCEEVRELLGPLQTQYCGCYDPEIVPEFKQFDVPGEVTVSVDVSEECVPTDTFRIEFYDGNQLYWRDDVPRNAGNESGGRWDYTIDNFSLDGPPGNVYDVRVSFITTGSVQGVICESEITVDPDPLP